MELTTEVHILNYEKAHLDDVVILHETCFTKQNNFSLCFGRAFVYRTYQFFLNDEKSFGFVAICDGQVVGVLLGRLDYYTAALNAYRFNAAVKGLIRNPILLFRTRVISQAVNMVTQKIFHLVDKEKLKSAPSHQDGKTATLGSICIHPNYRNRKFGIILLTHAEDFCRKNHMQYLRAGIQRSNIASLRTFRSRGYIEDEVLSRGNDLLYYLPLNSNL